MKLSPHEIEAIRERASIADRAMVTAATGRVRMSIPAQPDRETDLVCATLVRQSLPALIQQIEALEDELTVVRSEMLDIFEELVQRRKQLHEDTELTELGLSAMKRLFEPHV